MLEGLPMARKLKSSVGLKGAEKKLREYLTEFVFRDIVMTFIRELDENARLYAFR